MARPILTTDRTLQGSCRKIGHPVEKPRKMGSYIETPDLKVGHFSDTPKPSCGPDRPVSAEFDPGTPRAVGVGVITDEAGRILVDDEPAPAYVRPAGPWDDNVDLRQPTVVCTGWPTTDVHPPITMRRGNPDLISHGMCEECQRRMGE